MIDSKKVYVTPKVELHWAKVHEPDTKFNPDGDYSVEARVSQEQGQKLCDWLTKVLQHAHAEEIKRNPKAKNYNINPPFQPVEDENGNETGEVKFKFKMKAIGRSRTGDTWEQKPKVFDAKLAPVPKTVLIGNGSVGKVGFKVRPYAMPATRAVGLSMMLDSVQIIDLIEYQSGNNPFEVEDGFTTPAAPFAEASDDAFDAPEPALVDDDLDDTDF